MNLWQDIRYGVRVLRRSPGFLATAVLTLAVGIGVTSAVYSICDAMLWKPVALPHLETLVMVLEREPGGADDWNPLTPADFEDIRRDSTELDKVITHDTERVRDGSYGEGLITKFKNHNLPRIAISVDMLDTGIDIPEVTNLVFMKPVQSQIKLWQMIGRGTRSHETCRFTHLLPTGIKTEFKIIDFWENNFDKEAEETVPQPVPVLVRIFNTRLNMLKLQLRDQSAEDCQQVIADLRAQIAEIPLDSFSVKKVYPQIEEAWSDTFWRFLAPANIDFLRMRVGPLLRHVANVDVAEATFTSKVERLKYQILTNKREERHYRIDRR